jgi:hypothetical protein
MTEVFDIHVKSFFLLIHSRHQTITEITPSVDGESGSFSVQVNSLVSTEI